VNRREKNILIEFIANMRVLSSVPVQDALDDLERKLNITEQDYRNCIEDIFGG
jgi:hypothetical protein